VSPTRAELLAAVDRVVPDVVAEDLRVLFCGINPGLYTAWAGHHFARPGNRFWPALHGSGFTPRLLRPDEEQELLTLGLGVTNVVARATATAAELSREELREGGRRLVAVGERWRPSYVAVLGVTAYRAAFGEPRAGLGPQQRRLGPARVWVLPNPSGLNAHHQPADLARLFGELRAEVDREVESEVESEVEDEVKREVEVEVESEVEVDRESRRRPLDENK
jgi:TDG/mug DNA glycosylase family protein